MRNLYFCWILPRKLSYTHLRTGIVKKRWFSIDSTNLPPNAIIIKSLKEMKRADKERAFLRKTLFMRQATRNDDLQSLALMVQQMNSLILIWKTKLLKDGSISWLGLKLQKIYIDVMQVGLELHWNCLWLYWLLL